MIISGVTKNGVQFRLFPRPGGKYVARLNSDGHTRAELSIARYELSSNRNISHIFGGVSKLGRTGAI